MKKECQKTMKTFLLKKEEVPEKNIVVLPESQKQKPNLVLDESKTKRKRASLIPLDINDGKTKITRSKEKRKEFGGIIFEIEINWLL